MRATGWADTSRCMTLQQRTLQRRFAVQSRLPPRRWQSSCMSSAGSQQRPRTVRATRAGGDSAAPEHAGSPTSSYDNCACPPEHGTPEYQQHPGSSVDVDTVNLCAHGECPFPSHTAFDPASEPRRRLRNQACTASMSCRRPVDVLLGL